MVKKGQTLLSIGIILTISSIFGKILGFVRDILMFRYYGADAKTDAFFLAMIIPNMLIGVFTHSADGAIIGQYTRISTNASKAEADRIFSNIINILFCIGLVTSIFIWYFPDKLIKLFAPGFNEYQTIEAIRFLKYFSFLGLFHILYCFFSAYNTLHKYAITRAILSFTTNILVVLSLIFFYDQDMRALSLAYFIGGLLTAILPILTAFKIGFKYNFTIEFHNNELNIFIKNFIPIAGIAILYNTNSFIERFLAAGMPIGSISELNYAFKLVSIFDSMLVVGIGVIIIPYFAKLKADNNSNNLSNTITAIIAISIIAFLPLVIYTMIFYKDIVYIVYGRANNSPTELTAIANIFICYTPQILFVSLQMIMSRIFYAIENTTTPLRISIYTIIINIIASLILSKYMGVTGIALGTSLATMLSVVMYLFSLEKNHSICVDVFWEYDFKKYLLVNLFSLFAYNIMQIIIINIYLKIITSLFIIIILYAYLYFNYINKLKNICKG